MRKRKHQPRAPLDLDLVLLILLAKAPAQGGAVSELGDEAARYGIVLRTCHLQQPIQRALQAGWIACLGTCYPGVAPGEPPRPGRPAYRYAVTAAGHEQMRQQLELIREMVVTPAEYLGRAALSSEPYVRLVELDRPESDLLAVGGIEELEGWD